MEHSNPFYLHKKYNHIILLMPVHKTDVPDKLNHNF